MDVSGNPVRALNSAEELSRVGELHDQNYAYVHSAVGYWVYRSDAGDRALAFQGEFHYDRSWGGNSTVQVGQVQIAPTTPNLDFASATLGAIYRFDPVVLSVGATLPLGNQRLYDWNLTAQVNVGF